MSIRDLATPKSVTALDARYVNETDAAPLALAGQTPSQAPVAPTTAGAVGSLAFTARADHAHPSSGAFANFGDGSDGAFVFDGTNTYSTAFPGPAISKSGNTYTLTRSIYASSISISAGVTVVVLPACIIYCLGTLTNAGTITASGANASGATGGATASQSSTAYFGRAAVAPSGGTGNGGATGGELSSFWVIANGGNGGAGGTGTAGTGSTGQLYSVTTGGQHTRAAGRCFHGMTLSPVQDRPYGGGNSGGAGGGDGTNSGGGGGAGGTGLIVNALVLVNNGTIKANGGNGGTPTAGNCGGGGGGAGGFVFVNTTTAVTGAGTITATGGTGGTPTGTGVAGSTGGAGITQTIVW